MKETAMSIKARGWPLLLVYIVVVGALMLSAGFITSPKEAQASFCPTAQQTSTTPVVGATVASGETFSNPSSISIVDATQTGASPGNPYPSEIPVQGLSGTVSDVKVTLNGYSHGFPDDVAVQVVSPDGTSVLLMSDVGGPPPPLDGCNGVNGINLTLDDEAANSLFDSGQLTTGTYKPTKGTTPPCGFGSECFGWVDNPVPNVWPSPAPDLSGAHGQLSGFDGKDPNGTWKLYVIDDTTFAAGTFAGGWSLELNAADTTSCTKSGTSADETLIGTSGADVLCGLGGNDILKGLGGNDTLRGAVGNDTLQGGVGNDTLDGGTGTDTASYSASLTAVSASVATNTATGEGSDTFLAVENLIGSSKVDTLTGSGANNRLTGGLGNDTERGGSGNDRVIGSGGADFLYGQGGADTVNSKDGVGGNDTLSGGTGTDTKITDSTEKSIVGFP